MFAALPIFFSLLSSHSRRVFVILSSFLYDHYTSVFSSLYFLNLSLNLHLFRYLFVQSSIISKSFFAIVSHSFIICFFFPLFSVSLYLSIFLLYFLNLLVCLFFFTLVSQSFIIPLTFSLLYFLDLFFTCVHLPFIFLCHSIYAYIFPSCHAVYILPSPCPSFFHLSLSSYLRYNSFPACHACPYPLFCSHPFLYIRLVSSISCHHCCVSHVILVLFLYFLQEQNKNKTTNNNEAKQNCISLFLIRQLEGKQQI